MSMQHMQEKLFETHESLKIVQQVELTYYNDNIRECREKSVVR